MRAMDVKKKVRIKNTYRNGIETSEIEWPFFGHFDNVALERYFVVAIGGVLWRDAVILQHLLKFQKIELSKAAQILNGEIAIKF
jgi:hypothetical protein